MKEYDFATKKVFGLMDGGICDNQGLNSMLLANDRRVKKPVEEKPYNRFDFMMVSDVTSYYMSPYNPPQINTKKPWMEKPLTHYWSMLHGYWKKIRWWVTHSWWMALLVAIIFCLPLLFEGIGYASIALAVVGVALFILVLIFRGKYKQFLTKNSTVKEVLNAKTPAAIAAIFLHDKSFGQRTALKVVNYLQNVKVSVLAQMLNARLQSAITMVSEIFLKHVRRLIYDSFYENPRFIYRRMDNTVYKLSYTNELRIAAPKFEPMEDELPDEYKKRREAFRAEFNDACVVTDDMKRAAELAYTTGTTLWFEKVQETPDENNNRQALIATGQFTTCYNLLAYTLSLKHSRHFKSLDQKYQDRILSIDRQLKDLMRHFTTDPYYLFKLMEEEHN